MIELSIIRDLVAIFGVIAGFSYYVITVRANQRNQQNQLETRQAQLFWNIYDKFETRENSERFLNILTRKFESVEEFNEKYGLENNPEAYHDMMYYANLFEGLGVLVRDGLVNIRLVALMMSGGVKRYWELYYPVFVAYREEWSWPRSFIELEYLYDGIIEYGRNHPELQIA